MPPLEGVRVALLEARLSGELSAFVQRLGGTPYPVPAVREVRRHDDIAPFFDALVAGKFSAVVFLTGVGVSSLLDEADRAGRLEPVLAALRNVVTVCRGPKPAAALNRHAVPVRVQTPSPFTTAEMLDAMSVVDLAGRDIALVHYGERNAAVADALRGKGARVEELYVYEWLLPEDLAPLRHLVDEIIARRVDAVAFTSQVQWRHLLQVANGLGQRDALIEALTTDVVIAAIGPVCASALRSNGVIPDVVPASPKTGPMMLALAEYFELSRVEPS